MRNFAYCLFILVTAVSCKSPLIVRESQITGYMDRVVPYKDIMHKKVAPDKLCVLLPENPDTLKFDNSMLVEMLVSHGYRVIIPGKPGRDVGERLELDTREYRVKDITQLIASLQKDSTRALLVMGFGEGGYLVPKVAANTAADQSLIVNAGPYSVLSEYDALLDSASKNQAVLEYMVEAKGLKSTAEFRERIRELKENPYSEPQLVGGTNLYWLSYYEKPLVADIMLMPYNSLWLISEDFPLLSAAHRKEAIAYAQNLPQLRLQFIKGRGNFNVEGEMALLTQKVEAFINRKN